MDSGKANKYYRVMSCFKTCCKFFLYYPIVDPKKTWWILRAIGNTIIRQGFSESSKIKTKGLNELFPGVDQFPAKITPRMRIEEGEVKLEELVILSAACGQVKPKRIFEIGTFKGNTTLHLALNSPDDCEIFTLDLPPDARDSSEFDIKIGTIDNVSFTVGERFKNKPAEKKIKHLFGDSAKFDYSKFSDSMDLVFIDGNHQYDNVKADSEGAFEMIKPGGLIIWHDYTHHLEHKGVVDYIGELSETMEVFRIGDTGFVMGFKGEKK